MENSHLSANCEYVTINQTIAEEVVSALLMHSFIHHIIIWVRVGMNEIVRPVVDVGKNCK
jgi:hypothetical protein